MSETSPIQDVHFFNRRAPQFGMEIMTLERLFRRKINHMLETPHRVRFYHILVFTHGSGIHTIDFTQHAYDQQTLLLISAGQVQQFRVDLSSGGYLIGFTPEFLYENTTETDVRHRLSVFENALFAPRIQVAAQRRQLIAICMHMEREYQRMEAEFSGEMLRHWLHMLILHLARIQRTNEITQTGEMQYRDLIEFRRLIEHHHTESRSVQDYARMMAVSPKKLNEITRRVINKTAKEFIDEQVILEAQRLLALGSVPIKEIAFRLGFNDTTNLVKFFKKHTGVSPAGFRRQFPSL